MKNKKYAQPKNWVEASFAEIASYIQRGKSPKYIEHSELPVINQKCIRWNGIQKEYLKYIHPSQISQWTSERYLQDGDILWNSTGTGTIGRACLYNGNLFKHVVVDSHVTIVRMYKNYILPKYAFYFIMSPSIQKEIERMQTGSTNQVELGKNTISTTKIPVAPLNEQKRIVDKIEKLFSDLDDAEANLKKVQSLIKTYRQSVLKAAVTGELTKEWREKNKGKFESGDELLKNILKKRLEHSNKKAKITNTNISNNSSFFDIPKQWIWSTLENILLEGPTNGVSPQSTNNTLGIKSFKLTATTSGRFVINEKTIKYVDIGKKQAEKYQLVKGDILVQRGNTIDYVGTAAIFPGPDFEYIYPDLMMKLKVSNQIIASWIVTWINFKYAKDHFKKNATGTAGNMPKINSETLKNLIIPIPSEKEMVELTSLIDRLDDYFYKISISIDSQLNKINSLRQSVLKSAFEGKLVTQDPYDEPAIELLNRIKCGTTQINKKNQKIKKVKQ